MIIGIITISKNVKIEKSNVLILYLIQSIP